MDIKRVSSLAKHGAITGALLISILGGHALAAPLLVTFSPDSIPGVSGLGTFQANNYTLSDFTVATITNATGRFTQSGTLALTNFLNGSSIVPSSTSGLNNGNASNSYGLFVTFTASGYVGVRGGAFQPGSSLNQGFFSNISYNLIADPGDTDTVSATGVLTDNGAADMTLATGGVSSSGVNQVAVDVATPSADVLLSIVKTALGSQFFASPADLALQEDSFTNTTTVATISGDAATTTVSIDGGGGNGTFEPAAALPEPSSMLLFTGFAAATWFAKKRRHKS